MMINVRHVTTGSVLRKFQVGLFLLDRVYVWKTWGGFWFCYSYIFDIEQYEVF